MKHCCIVLFCVSGSSSFHNIIMGATGWCVSAIFLKSIFSEDLVCLVGIQMLKNFWIEEGRHWCLPCPWPRCPCRSTCPRWASWTGRRRSSSWRARRRDRGWRSRQSTRGRYPPQGSANRPRLSRSKAWTWCPWQGWSRTFWGMESGCPCSSYTCWIHV